MKLPRAAKAITFSLNAFKRPITARQTLSPKQYSQMLITVAYVLFKRPLRKVVHFLLQQCARIRIIIPRRSHDAGESLSVVVTQYQGYEARAYLSQGQARGCQSGLTGTHCTQGRDESRSRVSGPCRSEETVTEPGSSIIEDPGRKMTLTALQQLSLQERPGLRQIKVC